MCLGVGFQYETEILDSNKTLKAKCNSAHKFWPLLHIYMLNIYDKITWCLMCEKRAVNTCGSTQNDNHQPSHYVFLSLDSTLYSCFHIFSFNDCLMQKRRNAIAKVTVLRLVYIEPSIFLYYTRCAILYQAYPTPRDARKIHFMMDY